MTASNSTRAGRATTTPTSMLRKLRPVVFGVALVAGATASLGVNAQAGQQKSDMSARANASIDITGQWVAVVNEDWLWRMVTPPVGDAASVPLNRAGQAAANAWDLAKDRTQGDLCKAFGPPGLIRQPGRLRISWADDETLAFEFDAGKQTRRMHFDPQPENAPPSLQGVSRASWFKMPQSREFFTGQINRKGGALQVVTTNMTQGYLRPNGVPYSDHAVVKEFYNTFTLPDGGDTWLVVTTVVSDPVYLMQEFVISTQFKKEKDRSGWNPRPCEISDPLVSPVKAGE
jgi:hypothetical protein